MYPQITHNSFDPQGMTTMNGPSPEVQPNLACQYREDADASNNEIRIIGMKEGKRLTLTSGTNPQIQRRDDSSFAQ